MKNIIKYLLAFLIINSSFLVSNAQVAINEDGSKAHDSAMLDISSNSKGLLIPRMDSTARKNITTPAIGLMVFDSTTNSLWYYSETWTKIDSSAFVSENGITHAVNNSDNFVFGTDDLDFDSGTELKFLFNKSLGAFRAGMVTSTAWDEEKQGEYSFAAGQNTEAAAKNSTAFGRSTDATGENSIAFGRNTDAENENSASFGYYTEAQNTNATSFGNYTDAKGENSTSFGDYTEANGLNTSAFGTYTLAAGDNATAFGAYTQANSFAEFAIGHYNTVYTAKSTSDADDTDRLFVIGNGKSTNSRSDALIVYKSGDMELNGFLATGDSVQINLEGTRRFVVRENSNGNTVINLPNNNENTFLGEDAGDANATGTQNTYIGYEAGFLNEEGVHNTFSGHKAGAGNTSGNYNAFFGSEAGQISLGGDNNAYFGYQAGAANLSGSNNVFLGYQAGGVGDAKSGSSNVFLGYQAGSSETGSNKLYIESSNSSSPLIYGEFNNDRVVINGNSSNNSNNRTLFVNGSIGATSAFNNDSDRRLKTNIQTIPNALSKVLQMRGVTYQWKDGREAGKRLGFIAQEVEPVLPQVVDNEHDHYTMQYAPITAVLVEAVKEQQTQIEALQSENAILKAQVAKINQLEAMLEQLQAQVNSGTN